MIWTETPVPGAVTFYYRLVAVDDEGNISELSLPIAARAFDEALPVPPPLAVEWVNVGVTICAQATWTSMDEVLLQHRRKGMGLWTTLEDWFPPGTHIVIDANADSSQSYQYRLRVRKTNGALAIGSSVTLASMS
jgi:hypothetical protein